jgi:hypothetical protein
MLDMARNKDNFCVNRTGLLAALIEFADVLSPVTRGAAESALEPLALGAVEESSEYLTASETHAPLNRYQHESGRPEDVHGMALIALAALASGNAAASRRVGGQMLRPRRLSQAATQLRNSGQRGIVAVHRPVAARRR